MKWFDVDKEGLGKLLERRGKSWAIAELLQNAWDEELTTIVSAILEPIPGRHACRLSVIDNNPSGFKNLSHAWTLFAESYKKGDEKKRGRFNLGEKLVLAMCHSAIISSTTGMVVFENDERHEYPRRKRDIGTVFEAVIKMTRTEYDEVCRDINRLIPPQDIDSIFNGKPIPKRSPLVKTKAFLMTEISNEDGVLKRLRKETEIHIHEPRDGEVGFVYEMGIPVAETGDKYHVDIQQKVPLNMERDSLPEPYLRDLRAIVLNATSHLLNQEEAASNWVADALEDKNISHEAVKTMMDLRFGVKRVSYDPSDSEANSLAVAKGYTVVHGGTMSSKQWQNVRNAGAILPAGKVTPSPKPFSPDGKPLKTLARQDYLVEHFAMESFAKWLAKKVLNLNIQVIFADDNGWKFGGAYGPGGPLYINSLETRFSGYIGPEKFIDFLIHEFGHEFADNHLSEKYHEALTLVGARTALALRSEPEALGLLTGKK